MKFILLALVSSFYGCEDSEEILSPLDISMGEIVYVNSNNASLYELTGECIGDGLEIDYMIGSESGSIYCINKKWTISNLDLSNEEDGPITVKIYVGNGDRVISTSASITKDVISPILQDTDAIAVPRDNTYDVDDVLDFTVTFNENVKVDEGQRLPRIEIELESGSVYAIYHEGSGSNILKFSYVVKAGDADSDGSFSRYIY